MTHEEALKRWNLSKESKRECAEELMEKLKAEFKKMMGHEPAICEIW